MCLLCDIFFLVFIHSATMCEKLKLRFTNLQIGPEEGLKVLETSRIQPSLFSCRADIKNESETAGPADFNLTTDVCVSAVPVVSVCSWFGKRHFD